MSDWWVEIPKPFVRAKCKTCAKTWEGRDHASDDGRLLVKPTGGQGVGCRNPIG